MGMGKQNKKPLTNRKKTKKEKVAEATRFEIHLPALRHNFQQIKKRLQAHTKVLVASKHLPMGQMLLLLGFVWKKRVPIISALPMSLGCCHAKSVVPNSGTHPQMHQLSTLIEYQLEPCVYSWRILHALEKVLVEQQSKAYPIHLKFNTGLHRLGFSIDEGASLKQHLASSPFHLQGVLSHLAATEDPAERGFTLKQLAQFDLLKPIFGSEPIYHVLNTSGVFQYPEAHHDMIRCGIGLYGYGNQEEVSKLLRPVGVLKQLFHKFMKLRQEMLWAIIVGLLPINQSISYPTHWSCRWYWKTLWQRQRSSWNHVKKHHFVPSVWI